MTRLCGIIIAAVLAAGSAHAVELDPKAVVYTLPDNIKWVVNERAGNAQAVIAGDPTKPGLYVVLTKWLAGNHFSRPHFHPNDRFITVIKGTWWVGSGPNFDPANSTVPLPAGSASSRTMANRSIMTAPRTRTPC
jgi:hypothetical protein